MKVYSASEAVWPALERTYTYLFRSFRWETFLKLSCVATLCEGFLVSFRFYIPASLPFNVNLRAWQSFLFARDFLPVTIFAGAALFLIGIYCFYLVTRLRFAFVHSLIHQTRQIRKAGKLYAIDAERFFSASMGVWLVLLVALALVVVLVVIASYTVFAARTPEGKLDPGNFLMLFIPCIGAVFVLILAACSAQIVLNDFILPHMAVEGTPFPKAWEAVRERIRANSETFLSYFILRLAMPIAAGIVLGLLAWIVGWIVFGILGMSAAGFTAMLDGTTDGRALVLKAIQSLFLVLGFATGAMLAAAFGGPISVFMRSYALFFYGGHYKPLGNLLNPQVSAANVVD